MSRSYRHSPVFWNCHVRTSCKWYRKLIWHSERTRLRNAIAHQEYEKIEGRLTVYDEWNAPGDGKGWGGNYYPHSGFGVHNRYLKDKKEFDKDFKKSLRK